MRPIVATLLVHDLLLAKRGIAAPKNHPLYLAVSKYKARLNSEFTRIRLRYGYPTLELFREAVDDGKLNAQNGEASSNGETVQVHRHPRWVRVNRIKTTLEAQLSSTFSGFKRSEDLGSVMTASKNEKVLHVDCHIPDLIALPAGYDIARCAGYLSGDLIVQDKASCFPAYLLDVEANNGDIVDACAAPGNKTTQLAAFCATASQKGRTVHAFEKDTNRFKILTNMVQKAGGEQIITVHDQTDFLKVNSKDMAFKKVTAILLDPSCSGSGIVGRDEEQSMELPEATIPPENPKSKKRKRKHTGEDKSITRPDATQTASELVTEDSEQVTQRLTALSTFQLNLLQHAMSFPSATRIVYSTCSIHAEENENVVIRALALGGGWKLLQRAQQVSGIKAWGTRGDVESCTEALLSVQTDLSGNKTKPEELAMAIADACIRCEKSSEAGTIGFFVAGFVRDEGSWTSESRLTNEADISEEEEWNGFSESE